MHSQSLDRRGEASVVCIQQVQVLSMLIRCRRELIDNCVRYQNVFSCDDEL